MRSSASECSTERLATPALAGIDRDAWQALSHFRQAVYRALSAVPAGQVTTYGALAQAIGCRSARAVGQALRHNPFAPLVPCHRVLAGDLCLGGFNGQTAGPETARKRALLVAEGIRFGPSGRLADPTRLCILEARRTGASRRGVRERR